MAVYLTRQDRLSYLTAWEEWTDQPMPPSVVVRAVPGFIVGVTVPADATTAEAVVAFAQAYAARLRRKVFVALSRRESVEITESGDISGRFHTRPASDPSPLVSVSRQKFLFRTAGFGAVEPYVWAGPSGGPSS